MGVTKKPNETLNEYEAGVQRLTEVNLGKTDATELEICHLISAQTNSSKNQNRPRTVICKVNKFKDR